MVFENHKGIILILSNKYDILVSLGKGDIFMSKTVATVGRERPNRLFSTVRKLPFLLEEDMTRGKFKRKANIPKKCKVCKRHFLATSGRAETCSLNCRKKDRRRYAKALFIKKPWLRTIGSIKTRCGSKTRWYYKNGIKNYLSKEDIKFLWFRDKSYLMKQPSIHRIDPKGHYILKNCRYIEFKDNAGLHGRWSTKNYIACERCVTIKKPHFALGLCRPCYRKRILALKKEKSNEN